jgi:hypothetical protein
MREQIGTVRITRLRIYKLDPWASDDFSPATAIVEPGEYPVYREGLSHYWRMTGVLNQRHYRMGDGMFSMSEGDVPSDDDVVFYSLRYGPDEWEKLMTDFGQEPNPALVFTLSVPAG